MDTFTGDTKINIPRTETGIMPRPRRGRGKFLFFIFCIAMIVVAWTLVRPATKGSFPGFFMVRHGETLDTIARELKDAHYIRSEQVFRGIMIMMHGDRTIVAGDYYFDAPVSPYIVARRLATGNYNIAQRKITLPEGFSRKEMAQVLVKELPNIKTEEFLEQTKNDEGYLFPDTYFFSPIAMTADIVKRLRDSFEQKIAPLASDIAKSSHTEKEIITMASIIEKEAGANDDRAVIAGILWKRIANGIPLQVDAPFLYLLGKKSSDLTMTDLKIDSPYNTYAHKGLPPAPINNPGIVAIKAALYPTESPYYFYLHGKDGTIHYARTFEEHKKNKAKYLK